MRTFFTSAFAAAALVAGFTAGACATTPDAGSGGGDAVAADKGERDKNACLKMCEVAGDAEDNADAVASCKAACEG